MTDAFISYSRKDSDFARRLTNELVQRQQDVWIDWQDIPRGADWLNEIYAGIEAADTFILIVSQHSLISEVCNQEIARARQYNKRVIPVVRQRIEGDVEKIVKGTWVDTTWHDLARQNWDAIRHINWLLFEEDARFEGELAELLRTLDEDLPHRKAHTRYLVRALDWERSARNPSFLLIGDEIEAAERWLADSRGKQPEPDPLHQAYIQASREAETRRVEQVRLLERRVRQAWLASVVLGLVAGLALAVTIIAGVSAANAQATVLAAQATGTAIVQAIGQVETERDQREGLRLAAATGQILEDYGDAEVAAKLMARALDATYVSEADSILTRALGELPMPFARLEGDARLTAFTPDSRYLFSGDGQLFDAQTGKRLWTLDDDMIYWVGAQLNPVRGGAKIVVVGRGYEEIRIYDLDPQQAPTGPSRVIPTTPNTTDALLSPDERLMVLRRDQGDRGYFTSELLDLETNEVLAEEVPDGVFTPDNRHILSVQFSQGRVEWWDVAARQVAASFEQPGQNFWRWAVNPDWSALLVRGDTSVYLLELPDLTLVSEVMNVPRGLMSVNFTADERYILIGHYLYDLETESYAAPVSRWLTGVSSEVEGSPDGRIAYQDDYGYAIEPAAPRPVIPARPGFPEGALRPVFSRDGRYAAVDNLLIQVWRVEEAGGHLGLALAQEFPSLDVIDFALSPDGTRLLTGGQDAVLRVWDTATGQEVGQFGGHIGQVNRVAYSADGTQIMSASNDGTARLWDVASGREIRQVGELNGKPIQDAGLTPYGVLAAISGEGAWLFNLESGERLKNLRDTRHYLRLELSPDGRYAAFATNSGSVVVWDLETAEIRHELTGFQGILNSLAYSPDGERIAAAQGGLRVCDAETGAEARRLAFSGGPMGVAFSPDGRYMLLSGSGLRLVLTELEDMLDYACSRFLGELTSGDRARYNFTGTQPTCDQFATDLVP